MNHFLSIFSSFLLSIFLFVFPNNSFGDDYTWTGECGNSNWDACCRRGNLYIGNWTHAPMSSCSDLYPTWSDDAFINTGAVGGGAWIRRVHSLSIGPAGTLFDSNIKTTTDFLNDGTFLVGSGDMVNGPGSLSNYGLIAFGTDGSSTPTLNLTNIDSVNEPSAKMYNYGTVDVPVYSHISINKSLLENKPGGTFYVHPAGNGELLIIGTNPSTFVNRGNIAIESSSSSESPLFLSIYTENYGNVSINTPFVDWGSYTTFEGYSSRNIGAQFSLLGDSKLYLIGANHLFQNTNVTGSGSLILSGSTLMISGNNNIATPFEMKLGSNHPYLDLESDLLLTNTFKWTDGYIRAQSALHWPVLTLAGNSFVGEDNYVYLYGAKIKNTGVWDWRGAYGLFYSDRNGFIPMIENDGTIISNGFNLDYQGGGVGSLPWQMPFRNDGVLRILGTNVTDYTGVYLENNNEIRIEGGDLRVSALRNTTNANIFINGYAVFGGVSFGSLNFSLSDMISSFAGNAVTFGLGNSPGKIRGHGQIHGDAFFTNGYIDSYDFNLGLLKFFNALGLAERSRMILELAGRDDGSAQPPHDIVEAESMKLGGTLDLRTINGYTPQTGDTFSILRSTNIVGNFDAVKGLGVGTNNTIALQKTSSGILARVGNVASISATPQQITTLDAGRYLKIQASVENSGVQGSLNVDIAGSVHMESSNTSILSFDSEERAIPKKAGSVNVTATFQGKQIIFPVNVTSYVRSKSAPVITPVSTSYQTGPATGLSQMSTVSRNGKYVVYESDAENLIPNDGNSKRDIFRYNIKTGLNEIVSVTSSDRRGDYDASFPAISGDGRYIAYRSKSTNQGYSCAIGCVMVKDMETKTLTLASKSTQNGTPNNVMDDQPLSMSKNGQHIVFSSRATNLVSGDTNGVADVFIYNGTTSSVLRISTSSSGVQANAESGWPQISGNGRFVLFSSKASNLVTGDTNGRWDLFLYDRDPDQNGIFDEGNGTTKRVNTTSLDEQTNEQDTVSIPIGTISESGAEIVFQSSSSQLVPGDTNSKWDVFLKNISTNAITRLSTGVANNQLTDSSYRPWISSDGRYVVFYSLGNVTNMGSNGSRQVYLIDREARGSTLLSLNTSSQELGNGNSGWNQFPTVSDDGSAIAFTTHATNLFKDDVSLFSDVVVAQRMSLTKTRVLD